METKPGYLTTEFWTTITLNVLGIAQLITGSVSVSNKWVALAMAIVTGLYNGSRGLAKAGVAYKPVVAKKPVAADQTAGVPVPDQPNK